MKPNEVYRVKQYSAILAQKDYAEEGLTGFYADRLFFNWDMTRYCGTKVTLNKQPIKNVWNVYENGHYWQEAWLVEMPTDFLNDKDFDI